MKKIIVKNLKKNSVIYLKIYFNFLFKTMF